MQVFVIKYLKVAPIPPPTKIDKMFNIYFFPYSYLKASIGFNKEALYAG